MIFLDFLKENDDAGWINLAMASRKNNVTEFTSLAPILKHIYTTYDGIINNRDNDLNVSHVISHKDLLIDYYESPPKSLEKNIKHRRNSHGLDECPYCGYPFSPDTLDHFIPKDKLPEFSIFPNNLVPQCKYCAPIKKDSYYCTQEQTALFIHPIYFNLLSKVGFSVTASINKSDPDFEVNFRVVKGLSSKEKDAIKRHLISLKVKERFLTYCFNQYSHWKGKKRAHDFSVKQALQQRIEEKDNSIGLSTDWETAFCRGVLSCNELIKHLQEIPTVKQLVLPSGVEDLL